VELIVKELKAKDSELIFKKPLDICRSNEVTTSQLKSLSSSSTKRESEILAIQMWPTVKPCNRQYDKCGTHSGTQHHHQQNCPAYGLESAKEPFFQSLPKLHPFNTAP